MRSVAFALMAAAAMAEVPRHGAMWTKEQEVAAGYKEHVVSPLPSTYVAAADLPDNFTWGNVNGTSYLTKTLNQHIPQYCGSCWAHGALSAFADRIKIARKGKGIDINLSVQHILNCGNAGSCHGGSAGSVYNWIHKNADGVVYDTCQQYIACSSESKEGFCEQVDTTCTPMNTCRTCSTFAADGGFCAPITKFPNATIAEHGATEGEQEIMQEIFARGPVATGIDADKIETYHGGIAKASCPITGTNHVVSIVGWGTDGTTPYWLVRNSWGEYWGEMGYFRISRARDEDACLGRTVWWATPKTFTETNFPCNEDGGNCGGANVTDPSVHKTPLGARMY